MMANTPKCEGSQVAFFGRDFRHQARLPSTSLHRLVNRRPYVNTSKHHPQKDIMERLAPIQHHCCAYLFGLDQRCDQLGRR